MYEVMAAIPNTQNIKHIQLFRTKIVKVYIMCITY
ncbi:hypothetical protein BFGS084_02576 [Bacteroides fragilis]|nr:hypothetical protein BFGS084_02576 [Bacteroides fragilis]